MSEVLRREIWLARALPFLNRIIGLRLNDLRREQQRTDGEGHQKFLNNLQQEDVMG